MLGKGALPGLLDYKSHLTKLSCLCSSSLVDLPHLPGEATHCWRCLVQLWEHPPNHSPTLGCLPSGRRSSASPPNLQSLKKNVNKTKMCGDSLILAKSSRKHDVSSSKHLLNHIVVQRYSQQFRISFSFLN